MSGKMTRGLCALAAGTALAVSTLVTAGAAGAAPGAARSPAAAGTGRPAGAPGAQLWVRLYNGPGNSFDAASSVAARPGGATVYVTGTSYGGAATGNDYATVAYTAATRPSSTPDPVSCSTSHDCATTCIHVPVRLTACPARYSGKFGTARAANIGPIAGPGPGRTGAGGDAASAYDPWPPQRS